MNGSQGQRTNLRNVQIVRVGNGIINKMGYKNIEDRRRAVRRYYLKHRTSILYKSKERYKRKGIRKVKCPDCEGLMNYRAKQCLVCRRKGEIKNRVFCVDCNKMLSSNKLIRCKECWKKTKPLTNEKNPMWKGDRVGYGALHRWIERHKSKPKFCERCKHKPPYDLANISGEYKRDINDFEWLCRKCHMGEDNRLEILHRNNKKVKNEL